MSNRFVTLSDDDKRLLIAHTSQQMKLPVQVIEKDWWVTAVLSVISQLSYSRYVSFKGGTSLSKAWSMIKRFSEDVDIALDHSFFGIDNTSRSQRIKLRKVCRAFITGQLSKEISDALCILGCKGFYVEPVTKKHGVEIDGDKDPTVIMVKYESLFPSVLPYVQQAVKIEISCLSMNEPLAPCDISSMLSQSVPALAHDDNFVINTVLPSRTFLEKAFLLNEEYQRDHPRSFRMSRHLYDLERMMDSDFASDALSDMSLCQKIIQHRRDFYNLKYVDYDSDLPQRIQICPPNDILHDWSLDYEDLRTSFIYGESLSFDNLIERILILQERFHEA